MRAVAFVLVPSCAVIVAVPLSEYFLAEMNVTGPDEMPPRDPADPPRMRCDGRRTPQKRALIRPFL
jgi:hypothetical protein